MGGEKDADIQEKELTTWLKIMKENKTGIGLEPGKDSGEFWGGDRLAYLVSDQFQIIPRPLLHHRFPTSAACQIGGVNATVSFRLHSPCYRVVSDAKSCRMHTLRIHSLEKNSWQRSESDPMLVRGPSFMFSLYVSTAGIRTFGAPRRSFGGPVRLFEHRYLEGSREGDQGWIPAASIADGSRDAVRPSRRRFCILHWNTEDYGEGW